MRIIKEWNAIGGLDDDYEDEPTDDQLKNVELPAEEEYTGEEDEEEYEEEEEYDEINQVKYLIRQMLTNAGFEKFFVESSGLDITIEFILSKKEKLKSIIKLTNMMKKMKDDVLVQYESEVELWETKAGLPLFTFEFLYGKKKEKKEINPKDLLSGLLEDDQDHYSLGEWPPVEETGKKSGGPPSLKNNWIRSSDKLVDQNYVPGRIYGNNHRHEKDKDEDLPF